MPLHRLWSGYMSELLGLSAPPANGSMATSASPMPMPAGMHAKLVKADFHGSIVTGTCALLFFCASAAINRTHDKVRRSRNAALVGASGIVVQETENTFKVVTRQDKLKGACAFFLSPRFVADLFAVLPKQGSVFVFAVPLYHTGTATGSDQHTTVLDGPHVEFELYGNQFCFRAADRAGRKFKHKETIEL